MPTFSISDHTLRFERHGPPGVLDGVAERRSAVMRALEILSPVVRPLALEISFGPLDPVTFAVWTETDIRRLAMRAIPDGVANRSAYARPVEIKRVDELTDDVVRRALTPPHPDWDVATIRAPVTAARVTATDLTIEEMPSRQVPVIVLDGERWAVGPIDAQGYRLKPPIALTWHQDYGDIVLRVEAYWTLWWSAISAEQALDAAGFPENPI